MDDTQHWRWQTFKDADFLRKVLLVIALGTLALLLWRIADVLLLAFGAVLVAVVLHALADVLVRYLHVPSRWGLATASVVIFVLAIGMLGLFGAQIRVQLANVAERLPFAIDSMTKELGLGDARGQLSQMLGMGPGGGFVSRVAGIGGTILGGLADFFLVVIAGLYIAASPKVYRSGLVMLFPRPLHERVESSLDASGEALKLWLLAQFIAMTCVGVLSATALWMLGVPSAFALGLIAGIADFIPFIGPIIGALPAILIAATIDGSTVLWTILAFVAIQQIEGNVIFPLVGRRVVSLPPALGLFAIVASGALFGMYGVVFGFPLTVVAYVLVKKLYVRETLGEKTTVPGEKGAAAPSDAGASA
jgi:predicted PurR-regulated permease PerM